MGVYIKGMEKPKCCDECFAYAETSNGYGERWNECCVCIGSTYDDCPLVEVKTPHGRLIDADELEEDDNWSEWEDGFTSYSRLQISTQPAVIEAEESEVNCSEKPNNCEKGNKR